MSATTAPTVIYAAAEDEYHIVGPNGRPGLGCDLDECVGRLVDYHGLPVWRARILTCSAILDAFGVDHVATKTERYRIEVVVGGDWGVIDTNLPRDSGRTIAICVDMEHAYGIASMLNAHPDEWSTPLTKVAR